MKHKLKRILCLFLCLLTLPLEVLADNAGSGSGSNTYPSYTNVTKGKLPPYGGIGMAIGIQVMDGSRYTVDPNEEPRAGGNVTYKGLAETVKHFTYNYPNPMESSTGQSCYFLGKAGQYDSGNQYVYGSVGNINGDAYAEPITSVGFGTGSFNPSIHNTLFNKMVATEEMPQKVLTAEILDSMWASLLGGDNGAAKNVVHSIWGSGDFTSPSYSSDATWNFKRYLRIGVHEDDSDYKIRTISNYVATLLCVASQLPDDVQQKAYNAIKNFAISASTGKPFQPIVITAEACARTQWHNEVNGSDHTQPRFWRKYSDHIALINGSNPDWYRDTEQKLQNLSYNISSDITSEMMKAGRAKAGRADHTEHWGSGKFSGYKANGDNSTLGSVMRTISSVEESVISEVRSSFFPGASFPAHGPSGCGIYTALDIQIPDPAPPVTAAANFAPVGKVGISVSPNQVVLPVGAYSVLRTDA